MKGRKWMMGVGVVAVLALMSLFTKPVCAQNGPPMVTIIGHIAPNVAHNMPGIDNRWNVVVRMFRDGQPEHDFTIKADNAGNFVWRGPAYENGYYWVYVDGGWAYHIESPSEKISRPGQYEFRFVMRRK